MQMDLEEDLKTEEEVGDDEIFVEYDIATYPSDLTLSVLSEMLNNGDILIPDFQREFVWSIKQSSLLIESFLLGLPVPQVFLYIDEENRNLVIDGQQRILSVKYFFEGYFGSENTHGKRQVFRLQGLDLKSPFANKRFADLDDSSQRKIKNSVLRAMNIRQINPPKQKTSIYHIFERLNTGGTALKPQEIRNCVFRGEFVKILRRLNENPDWHMILGKKNFDKHQKDVELILRLFALSQYYSEYEKPMKEFLNMTMLKNRNGDSSQVRKFSELFPKTALLIRDKLGEKPFHLRGPLNTSLLDATFCALIENINSIPEDLAQRFENLKCDKDFLESSHRSTSDVSVIKRRFEIAKSVLIGK